MSRTAKAARARQAGQLKAVLEQLDAGKIRISGPGHDVERTRARIEKRLAELEAGRHRG
jgi:ribosomal protein L14E/L6E/L27E